MFNRNFLISLCLFVSAAFAESQYLQPGEASTDFNPDSLQSNFDEFSPVFDRFLSQARQMIAQKNFKQARESLAPFIQQQRIRLGFNSRAYVEFVLKDHTAEQVDRVQAEMVGQSRFETSLHYVSSDAKDAVIRAIRSSLPSPNYLDSILKYKRTLLLSLQASLGEFDSYAGQDKKYVARQISPDFLFLIAPALVFQTPHPDFNLVIFEHEINHSREQMNFETDLTEMVQTYSEYFEFTHGKHPPDVEYRSFKTNKTTSLRRRLMLKTSRGPAAEPVGDEVVVETPSVVEAPAPVAEAAQPEQPRNRRQFERPTAQISATAMGELQFDLHSLHEIESSNQPVATLVQQLKDYLLSSTMVWGQRRIEYNSSFTHSNTHIKVLVKNFPLSQNFLTASVQYYLQDLTIFYRYAKDALSKSNSLSTRDAIYNCIVRQSLAPQNVNCDELIASASMYDENVRRGLTNSYMRLLRYSRITFEHAEALDYAPDVQTTCDQIAILQKEMLNSYKSVSNSYLPSLMNIQGPSFKSLTTGQRDHLCRLSLNPLLQ